MVLPIQLERCAIVNTFWKTRRGVACSLCFVKIVRKMDDLRTPRPFVAMLGTVKAWYNDGSPIC